MTRAGGGFRTHAERRLPDADESSQEAAVGSGAQVRAPVAILRLTKI